MPYLYFIILLFFLFLLSLLITWQLYNFTKLNVFSNLLKVEKTPKVKLLNHTDLFRSLKKLSSRKLWFDSLMLLESQLSLSADIKHNYFNAVGVIYQEMNQYDLAKLYFSYALLEKHNYAIALRNLNKLKD